ncbi:MAG: RND transporter [Candidatus Rokuibacteriota bacterium]|nr:MAG: RND transporter [Candidatus Rokubacteria bacterium]
MWIVRVALARPYTFVVLALLILIASPVAVLRTPTDIFPNIDIPVIAVAWQFTGLNPEEMEGRITTQYERVLTTTVDNIEHIESTTVNGQAMVKIFLQPNARLDTANAQVTAVSQTILRLLPPGIQPPLIINYSASTVPILQLALSGLSESELNDVGLNFLRTQLVTVPGASIPFPYGGKQRQVMVDLDPRLLQSKGLSPADVVTALGQQNIVLPSGTAKIGEFEYDVAMNASPRTVAELNDLPVKVVGNSTIYLRDVAHVRDGFAPQTNVVRRDGNRGTLVTILKTGTASTLDVVAGIRAVLPRVMPTLPPQLTVQPLADQSIFVRAAVSGVIREAVIAACLTAAMILLFLGSWRSTLIIAVSIPLSVLTSVIALSLLGETINIMTLGGLALAVGILVDDATVEVENINRNLDMGKPIIQAILDGAQQIAVPALVSTLCICIVFLPMFLLGGVARYLFVPLAEAVIFAMLASYLLSRTLVPTIARYLLSAPVEGAAPSRNPLARGQQAFERGFERVRLAYRRMLTLLVGRRVVFIPVFLAVCASAFLLAPGLGENFFPDTDSGQFTLHLRTQTGTRIEETARLTDLVEAAIRREIPTAELDVILDNIGLPYSAINWMHSASGVIGAADADVLVSLRTDHRPTANYVRALRQKLPQEFPGVTFYFLPADIVTQIINFGLPAPIDIQIEGADIQGNRRVADKMLNELRQVPGLADLRVQQRFDYPRFDVAVDRTKAAQGGFTERDLASSLLVSLSGSFQTTPTFFLNWQNGVTYNVATQTPQYRIQSLYDIENIPISAPTVTRPGILANVASITRSREMAVLSHYNIRRVVDLYGALQDRDLGAVGRDIARIVDANRPLLPRGSFLTVRGQLQTMRTAYIGLLAGLGFSIVLVYLLIVVNFQSWLDPFIIITALPAALAGIVVFLFLTGTTLSVPALMGAIMSIGVATANSILVVAFAKERLGEHGDAARAAIEAGFTRFRPVLMTALAMIIGMVPMALGLGEGGEQNAPLGRAVIGGLLCATVATLVFVPSVFAMLHGRRSPVASR